MFVKGAVLIPVMVTSHSPHTNAANWLRVKQTVVLWVNQGQHSVLKHQQHTLTL